MVSQSSTCYECLLIAVLCSLKTVPQTKFIFFCLLRFYFGQYMIVGILINPIFSGVLYNKYYTYYMNPLSDFLYIEFILIPFWCIIYPPQDDLTVQNSKGIIKILNLKEIFYKSFNFSCKF